MAPEFVRINLATGWTWILLGFLLGSGLGIGFHREDWLGGYASLKRRLLRLAHIAFFGMAIVNLLFAFTARLAPLTGPGAEAASLCFVLGAAAMPACCLAMALRPQLRLLFAIPIGALVAGGLLTVVEVLR